jgi:leucyl aminopeptidase
MGNTNDADRFVQSAAKSGENAWRMPLPVELRALLNSDIADLINGRPGNTTAGMLLAGVFLEEFVGNKQNDEENSIPWIHLDIAGTADNAGSAYGFTGAGPTGVTVRALIDFVRSGA